jgi:hypothetical protein
VNFLLSARIGKVPAVIRGEEAFQAARRQRRNAALLGAAVVLVCLIVAA